MLTELNGLKLGIELTSVIKRLVINEEEQDNVKNKFSMKWNQLLLDLT